LGVEAWRLAGEEEFDLEAIVAAFEGDFTGGGRVVGVETVNAGGDDGGLQLKNEFGLQASGIGEVADGATGGGGEAGVRIQREAKVKWVGGHGYLLEARATSQASRHSGQ